MTKPIGRVRMQSSAQSECPTCSGTGWEFLPATAGVRPCSRRCWQPALIQSTIPPLYWEARLRDFSKQAEEEVGRWLEQPGYGLLVVGPVGTGKTYLAAAIARWAIEADMRVCFTRASDFFAELRDVYHIVGGSEASVMEKYKKPHLLILDDLGSGSLSDHERRSTLSLLDSRLNYLLPTVVTSNLTLERIGALMDERIASRLSSFRVLALTGRDRRKKN